LAAAETVRVAAMSKSELYSIEAAELTRLIARREVSAVEVMRAHLDRVAETNPRLNAIVTLLPEKKLLAEAENADRRVAAGESLGPLLGLPVAHKDLTLTRGIRTTFGSPLFADFIPDEDALIVARLQAAGAITIGKTNTPEFGAGSQTFNQVFGPTRNPWDESKTCGGSSGGAAAALAAGMIPIADGSDYGGSLRNPASFCGVVGLRPSPGRVPVWPDATPWFPVPVQGPMARTASDVALMLSAIAGPDSRALLSLPEPGEEFRRPLGRDFRGVRVAWSMDFGGVPFDPAVPAALAPARRVLAGLGCDVDDARPNFDGAAVAFDRWRAWFFELNWGPLLDRNREDLKETVIWNIEQGRALDGPALAEATRCWTALLERMRTFFKRYQFLVLPVSQVPPFDVNAEYPTEIAGVPMRSYTQWMASCAWISLLGSPAVSVPAGSTPEGLPVGLQIVGRPGDDFGVLQLAHAIERESPDRTPPDSGN
jgi:amidase